jgi:predicted O-methyltransferase YrrM
MMGVVWYLAERRSCKNLNILEVGSWYGASALTWAEGLVRYCEAVGSITCVDAWQPFFDERSHEKDVYREMDAALASDGVYDVFLHNLSTLPATIETQHIRGKSRTVLPMLRPGCFDLVFVDANHVYSAVVEDLRNAAILVKEGGILCGDDLNLQLHQCDEAFARAHGEVDYARDPKVSRGFHPGVTVAVAEVIGRVCEWGGFWAVRKAGECWESISLGAMPEVYPAHLPSSLVEDARAHMADIRARGEL